MVELLGWRGKDVIWHAQFCQIRSYKEYGVTEADRYLLIWLSNDYDHHWADMFYYYLSQYTSVPPRGFGLIEERSIKNSDTQKTIFSK